MQATVWGKTIIPAEDPTIAAHPETSSRRSIARLQIPLSFYLKSDRFGDFWASEWFEGILKPPDL